MTTRSKISWLARPGTVPRTWNPVRGCTLHGPDCLHCYAMRQAHRFNFPGGPYEGLTKMTDAGPVWTGEIRLIPEAIDAPRRWTEPSTCFVDSMADLFHRDVPFPFIDGVYETIRECPQHLFIVLTKRIDRARQYYETHSSRCSSGQAPASALPNLWLGLSAGNQTDLDRGIYNLLATPAAVHVLSLEPLCEMLDLSHYLTGVCQCHGAIDRDLSLHDCPYYKSRVDWIIVGGESGPSARACDIEWIRYVVKQAGGAGIRTFVKQMGADPVYVKRGIWDGNPYAAQRGLRLRDQKGEDPSEWPEQFPREWPEAA